MAAMRGLSATVIGILAACVGCTSSSSSSSEQADAASLALSDSEYRSRVVQSMHDVLLGDIDVLLGAAQDLQAAAPIPPARGWDPLEDAAAIDATKAAWFRARSAYERVEGALAPLFPDIDRAIDARYDDFLAELGPGGDPDPFDGQGVTGMHAIERILWSDAAPGRVVDFEKTLPGYAPAAFPATEQEAARFASGLCGKLATDITSLRGQWQPVHINVVLAFEGLVSLMNEQREKVRKAASNEEESRYAQRTMTDIRDNLDGTKAAFSLFEPWLATKKDAQDGTKDGPTIDGKIQAGFDSLAETYASVSGEAVPAPPPTWSSESPSPGDLATPFGKLYSGVDAAVDPNDAESIVAQMNDAGAVLGFPVPPH
jgi:iron uptake system component EfeO